MEGGKEKLSTILMFSSPRGSQQIYAFAFSYLSAIALFWTTLTINALSFSFFLPFSLKYCNFYPLAPQFPSFLLQVLKEAANIFWVPRCSSSIFPPHLSWIAATSPPIKFALPLIPFKKLHSTISYTKSSFLYNTFYIFLSTSVFEHFFILPCNPSKVSCQVEQEQQ